MYNMLSIALTGTEQYMCHLRLLTACSLITHRDHMIEVMKPTAQVLLPQSKQSAASIAKKAENEWLDLLLSTRRSLGKSISPAHTFYSFRKDNLCLWLLASSSSLGRPMSFLTRNTYSRKILFFSSFCIFMQVCL